MFMRRRRPLLRAAMVGAVGYHAGKRIQEGREDDAERDARLAQLEAERAAASSGGSAGDMIDQLGRLGQLREQGVLTDAEFEVQKQKLLQGA